jgi:DNA-binding transcriptional LysR family regulator
MALTDTGRRFYANAKLALEAMADAEAVAAESTGRLSGRLKVHAPVATPETAMFETLFFRKPARAHIEAALLNLATMARR